MSVRGKQCCGVRGNGSLSIGSESNLGGSTSHFRRRTSEEGAIMAGGTMHDLEFVELTS